MHRMLWYPSLLVSLFALPACSSEPLAAPDPNSLADPDNVRTWANTASALGAYLYVWGPVGAADGQRVFSDAACPARSDDGTMFTIQGDCTDAMGGPWVGRAEVTRSANGDRALTLDGFGNPNDPASGNALVSDLDATTHGVEVHLTHASDVVVSIDYEGQVVGGYDSERTIWSGSGSFTRTDGRSPVGTIHASTTDEVLDRTSCSPASGTTTLADAGGNTVVVTYYGGDACTATYSFNGALPSDISGIACSLAPARRSSSAVLSLLLPLLGLCGRRLFRRDDSCTAVSDEPDKFEGSHNVGFTGTIVPSALKNNRSRHTSRCVPSPFGIAKRW